MEVFHQPCHGSNSLVIEQRLEGRYSACIFRPNNTGDLAPVTPELLEQAAQAIRDHQAEQERKARVLVEFKDKTGDPCKIELTTEGVQLFCCDQPDYTLAWGAGSFRKTANQVLTDLCKAYHQLMLEREAKA